MSGCCGARAATAMALELQMLCAPSTSVDISCCLPGYRMARGEKQQRIWGCNIPPPQPCPPYASFGKLWTTTIRDICQKLKPGDCMRWKEGESGCSFLGMELYDDDDDESLFVNFSSCLLLRKPQVATISTLEAFGQRGGLGLRRHIGWRGRAKECEGRWGTTTAGVAAGCWAGNRVFSEGLSCIFVGPIETAEKAHLEALYEQVMTSLKKMIFRESYKGIRRCCFLVQVWFKQSSLQNSICSGSFLQQKAKCSLFADLCCLCSFYEGRIVKCNYWHMVQALSWFIFVIL